jgi:DNA-binding response OmpR family regulator
VANLLLIDDDPDLLPEQVAHVFPAPAHRVEVAHTGAEGLRRVAAVLPDVILLDLRLPDQSGLEVLRQVRQMDARIPVVFVTVVRSADSAIEAVRHGAYDYLLKPLDLQKRTHTANWTGSCCPASWGTRGGVSSGPPSCWESPSKPCA